MKLSVKTALGVDISQGLINMALLRQSAKGIELVGTASGPVPDGAIEDGRITDSAALAKAIKELKNRNKMRARKAAVSLSVSPVVIRILEIPKGSPKNIGQFVLSELKSYVALSGREITFDFCGLKSEKGSGSHLLAVGADDEDVTELIGAYIRAGMNIEAVEPEMIAYIRALYAGKIQSRFDCNVLLGLLHDRTLTLCVFRKQTLDFVRIEDISFEKAEPEELCRRLGVEINAITRFYDIEIADKSDKWEVTVLSDCMQLPVDAGEFLRAGTSIPDLEVITGENLCKNMIVDPKGCQEKSSALAVSLAMGLLNTCDAGPKINLVPPESAEVRSVKKQLKLTTVTVAVVIPLLAFMAGKGLSMLADKVHKGIEERKKSEVSQDTSALLKEQKFLEQQIELLSTRPEGLNAILDSRRSVDWASVLDEVKSCTPEAVRITAMYNKGKSGMGLEGLALSYEAARLFVKKLNESDYIDLASLSEAMREDAAGGLVTYTIDCTVTDKKSQS